MAFPFLPGGLPLALTVLGGIFVAFGVALQLIDRTSEWTRGSIAAGLEAGLRTWGHDRAQGRRTVSPAVAEPAMGAFRLLVHSTSPSGPAGRPQAAGDDEEQDGVSDDAAGIEELGSAAIATERVRPRRRGARRTP